MKKKQCAKYLIWIGCVALVWWLGMRFCYNCIPPGSVMHFAKAMEARDADALAMYVDLPFDLKYPIPRIKTMEEFVAAIPLMVDEDTLEDMLDEDKWQLIGWRGYHHSRSGAWMTTDIPSTLVAFNGLSDAGKAYWKECVKREIESLHPSLRDGIDKVKLSFKTKDGAWFGRIDCLKEEFEGEIPAFSNRQKYRMAVYKKGTPLTAKPDVVVICRNICEGSANNAYYDGVDNKFGFYECNAGQLEDLGFWFSFPGPDGKACNVEAEACDWDPAWMGN